MASKEFLAKAYLAYFGRPVDVTGSATFATASEADVISMFSASAESAALYGTTDGYNKISAIYQNVFGRAAEVEGATYWLNQIATGKETYASVAVSIINAGMLTDDQAAIENKLAASELFTDSLDTPAEAAGYSGAAAAAVARDFLAGVSAAPATEAQVTAAVTSTVAANVVAAPSFVLGIAQDNVTGTSGADTFVASIVNNSNTLQSGDVINGGAGVDRLEADIGNSQNFAITPVTTGVETVAIRAQAVAVDTNNNNMTDPGTYSNQVQIDAERMKGVTQWESNNSRADVVIEDVRILDTQITKDITIAMVETDPGNVDLGVYFDQYSLRSNNNASSTLRLELLDTRSKAAGTADLLDNPYWGFTFKLGGVTQAVTSTAIDAAQTYPELLAAIKAAIAAIPALASVTAELGSTFSRVDTLTGTRVTGTEIVLKNTGAGAITIDGTTGWQTQNGTVPSSSGLHTFMSTLDTKSTDKVTAKIILDDVGRGSTGGDLVVGGLSVGDTSTSLGVERFEIEVRDNSKLQTINSTNNTLQEVTVKNGVTSSKDFAYVSTVTNKGNLTVRGNVNTFTTSENTALPGSADQHNGYGFSDVREINATGFDGKFDFNAEITAASIAKYMNLADVQANPVETNVAGELNKFGTGAIANFMYTGGNNDDTMIVHVDGGVASSRSTVIAGREDFTFNIDGGSGNDAITVRLIDNSIVAGVRNNPGNNQNWYNNQDLNNNVTILGGAGNDTIRKLGAGDVKIDAGSGNDAVYTDNTGFQTVNTATTVGAAGAATSNVNGRWVFNTTDQVTALDSDRNQNDLRSDTNESYNFYNSKLTVTFKDIPTVTMTVAGTGYKTTDLQLNQAIKSAILGDATLSKLLSVQDGPANSLIVTSLIDGVMTTADLTIGLTPLTLAEVTALSPADIAAAGAVYLPANTVATAALVHAAITAAHGLYTTNGDYATAMANDGTVNVTGAASLSTSDNIVAPGTGDDVVVLGTTVGADTAASSNETVVLGAGFGKDVIVNFATTGFGIDHLDFTALKGTAVAAAGVYTTDKAINIQLATSLVTSPTVTTKIAIETLYNANNLVAQDHVFVAVDGSNVGSVYSVTNAIGAANAIATLEGTIDLATSSWLGLTSANFVNSSAFNFNLAEGPTGTTGGVVPPIVVPGTFTNSSVDGLGTDAAAVAPTLLATAGAINYTDAVATRSNVSITGFGADDQITITGGTSAQYDSAISSSGTNVSIAYNNGGVLNLITLVGVNAGGAFVNDVASFNALAVGNLVFAA